MSGRVVCTECFGEGTIRQQCAPCGGGGTVSAGAGDYHTCTECEGEGYLMLPCGVCAGEGTITEQVRDARATSQREDAARRDGEARQAQERSDEQRRALAAHEDALKQRRRARGQCSMCGAPLGTLARMAHREHHAQCHTFRE